jgi:hypothetical protein
MSSRAMFPMTRPRARPGRRQTDRLAGDFLPVTELRRDGLLIRHDGAHVRGLRIMPPNPLVLDDAGCEAMTRGLVELLLRVPAGVDVQLVAHATPVASAELIAAARNETRANARDDPAYRALAACHERSLLDHADQLTAATVHYNLLVALRRASSSGHRRQSSAAVAIDADRDIDHDLVRLLDQLRGALAAIDHVATPLDGDQLLKLLAQRLAPRTRQTHPTLCGDAAIPAHAIAVSDIDTTDHRHVEIDGGLERTMYLSRLPERTFYGWLLHAMQQSGAWTLSVHIEPRDRAAERERFNRKARRLWGVNEGAASQRRRPDRTQHEQEHELEALVAELSAGAETICDVAIYLTLRVEGTGPGPRQALGDAIASWRRDAAAPVDAAFSTLEAAQGDLWIASLPLALDRAGRTVPMITRNAADSVPLLSTSFGSPGGLPLGVATPGRSIERLDPFDQMHDNATTLIFAKSGGGKTMTTIALISAALTRGAQVSVIDRSPGHYAFLTSLLPRAAHLEFTEDADSPCINPWDTPDPKRVPRAKLAFLVRLHALLVGEHDPAEETYGLSALERNLLGLAIRRAYASAVEQETPARESLLQAVLIDMANETASRRDGSQENATIYRTLADRLTEYVGEGSYGHLFDRLTTHADHDAPLLVLNTRALPEDVSDAVLFAQLEHVTARVERRHHDQLGRLAEGRHPAGSLDGTSVVVLEELWRLLRRRATATWVIELVRRARHLGLWFIAITQQRSDLAGSQGTALLDNSTIQIFLRNGADDITHVAEALGLTRAETEQIRRLSTEKRSHAQAYVINGERGRGTVTIRHGEHIYWLATSDPVADLPLRELALHQTGYHAARNDLDRCRAGFAALDLLADRAWRARHDAH